MKFAPINYTPGSAKAFNGTPTASAHAIQVDQGATYLAAAHKMACPATATNPMSEIKGTGYTDAGWARFMLWVPPFTKYIGFQFWAMGSGELTISTPNNTADDHLIKVEVKADHKFLALDGNDEWDCSTIGAQAQTAKDNWSSMMFGVDSFGYQGVGILYKNGPPMPNTSSDSNNRAIVAPFLRYPAELEVHVKVENNTTDDVPIVVWPFTFFFYTPGPELDLSTAATP